MRVCRVIAMDIITKWSVVMPAAGHSERAANDNAGLGLILPPAP
jgi:hypothetical protein